MSDDDGRDLEDAVDLVERELDAEVIETKEVRGALVPPRPTGPRVTGTPPPPKRGRR